MALPDFIHIGTLRRPHRAGVSSGAQVQSLEDLPSRLFLGDRVPESFKRDQNGWRVRYADLTAETGVDLEYDCSSHRLLFEQTWRGVRCGLGVYSGDRLAEILRHAYFVFPSAWDALAKSRLEASFNLHYVPTNRDAHLFAGFPDGAFKTVLCPIPISRLRHSLVCHQAMEDDPGIAAGVMSYLSLGTSWVNYIQGKCPNVPSDPLGLLLHTLDHTGLTPLREPERQTAQDGSSAFTVLRLHYILVVGCAFRDLERVVGHLHGSGLIGAAPNGDPVEMPPSATEWRAIVVQSGLEFFLRNLWFFDPAITRRVVYEQFVPEKRLKVVKQVAVAPRTDPIEEITRAEECSRRLGEALAAAAEEWARANRPEALPIGRQRAGSTD